MVVCHDLMATGSGGVNQRKCHPPLSAQLKKSLHTQPPSISLPGWMHFALLSTHSSSNACSL
jgi:hypothetical protein